MSEEPQATPLRLNAQPSQDGGPAGPSQGTPSPAAPDANQGDAGKTAESPLRLKLRPRATTPETPAVLPSTPATPEAASTEPGAAKIRLKPRLIAETETKAAQSADVQPAAPRATEPVPILFKTDEPTPPGDTIPPTSEPAATTSTPEAPLPPPAPIPFKPKLKVPDTETQPNPETPATDSPAVEKVVPPFLVVPTAPSPARPASNPPFVVGAPKVPHIKGPDGTVQMPEAPAKGEPAKRTAFKVGVAIAATIGGLIVIIGGYALLKVLTPKPQPPPKPVVAIKRPAATKPATAPAKPATIPSSVGQVQALISATQKAEQARVDALASGQPPPDTSAAQSGIQWAPTAPGQAQAKPATAMPPTPAPSLTAQPPPPPPVEVVRVAAPPQASAAFRRFVANASIPGVFQGTPPRALINGRTVQAGELADRNLGIIFLRIDAEKKTITFKDGTGAEVTRSY